MANDVVTAPLVISKNEDGTDLYLYEGQPVPDHVKADERKRLEGLGLIGQPENAKAKPAKADSE